MSTLEIKDLHVSVIPVSYTHLDVYKRQVVGSVCISVIEAPPPRKNR